MRYKSTELSLTSLFTWSEKSPKHTNEAVIYGKLASKGVSVYTNRNPALKTCLYEWRGSVSYYKQGTLISESIDISFDGTDASTGSAYGQCGTTSMTTNETINALTRIDQLPYRIADCIIAGKTYQIYINAEDGYEKTEPRDLSLQELFALNDQHFQFIDSAENLVAEYGDSMFTVYDTAGSADDTGFIECAGLLGAFIAIIEFNFYNSCYAGLTR
jgi:hypothetical protein